MNELYEFAKQVDVLLLFCFFTELGFYGIISGVMEIIFFIGKSIKKHILQKNKKKKPTEE